MILLLLQSIYFIVPAYFANMAPVIAKRLRILKEISHPVDMNTKLEDGKPLFGRHKTYRGIIVAVITGILFAYVQKALYSIAFFRDISIIDYSNPALLGILLGAGAITGDLLKSFFKRRINIRPGRPFIPFDQVDFVIGAYIFAYPAYAEAISFRLTLSSLIASFVLHIAVNHLAYYLKIRKEKW
ncbi:CDP-2,3-bis-(O-geranylgeranyl)-sn-glycerol synthase [Candidatus Woesearchaeota archaeon]|nr:CDP-2,3-bis-(O-geranylgeranyl)-sn-glycerol synthase [Candidatus Woesearchaeota archaeon]